VDKWIYSKSVQLITPVSTTDDVDKRICSKLSTTNIAPNRIGLEQVRRNAYDASTTDDVDKRIFSKLSTTNIAPNRIGSTSGEGSLTLNVRREIAYYKRERERVGR
jgi:hypothetical protein